MQNLSLKLIIDKGPRKGETLESLPGSAIKIGRVLKGNTCTIRESGISQQHLKIEFSGQRWTIFDLDSSNGTLLNGDLIQPMVPIDLSHGDTIKIGEKTSISVKIEKVGDGEVGLPEVQSRRVLPRRAPSRRTRGKNSSQVDVIPEETKGKNSSEVDVIPEETKGKNSSEVDVIPAETKENGELKNADVLIEDKAQRNQRLRAPPKKKIRVNKGSVRVSEVQVIPEESKIERVPENMDNVVREKIERLPENVDGEKIERIPENVDNAVREKVPENVDNAVREKVPENVDCEVGGGEDKGCSSSMNDVGEGTNSAVGVKDLTDLRKMTLGEWFERMEEYLPRKVSEAADEVIGKLREREKQFKEFVGKQIGEKI